MRRVSRGLGRAARVLVLPLAVVALLLALKGHWPLRIGDRVLGFSTGVVDWVDFVQVHGISYLASADRGSRELESADLGPPYTTVRFMLSGNVNDPNYRTQDGDAAFLPAGTTLYVVRGYAPSFRLAARRAGRLVLYEADTNPRAKRGADLLDIGGKVHSIAVLSADDGTTVLGTISDAAQVRTLTAMVLAAPVNQSLQAPDSARYVVAFNLADGTRVTRMYWPATGELSRGILLPPAFAAAVTRAIGSATA